MRESIDSINDRLKAIEEEQKEFYALVLKVLRNTTDDEIKGHLKKALAEYKDEVLSPTSNKPKKLK